MTRRGALLGTATVIGGTAGCLDALTDADGPEARSFDVTITMSDDDLAGSVADAAIEDVVQVRVGDTATFTFTNETDEVLGVHDHASDAEIVVDPGREQAMEFEVTEAMIGRQEIEAWIVDETDQDEGGHDVDATAIVIVEVRPRGS